MQPTVKVVPGGLGSEKLAKSLQVLLRQQVYVGVPEKDSTRKSGEITNAALAFIHTNGARASDMRRIVQVKMNRGASYEAATAAYLHTHGSYLYQIPPRPIIQPAIEAKGNKELIQEQLKLAAKAALDSKPAQVRVHLRLAGMIGQNVVRAWFTDPRNNWAPNAPSTIARKHSARPLIDTGDLRKSMTYVLSEE